MSLRMIQLLTDALLYKSDLSRHTCAAVYCDSHFQNNVIEDEAGKTTESFRSCQLPLEDIKGLAAAVVIVSLTDSWDSRVLSVTAWVAPS